MTRLRLLLVTALMAALVLAGCSNGSPDPRDILESSLDKAGDVSVSSQALVFAVTLSMHLESGQGDFLQQAEMAGTIEMPDREGYESLEYWSGSMVSESPMVQLSYVTLDGGKTAYIKGSQLETRLGVAGWVYIAPTEEQDFYFDYLSTVQSVAAYAEEVTLAGEEELNGTACWHLRIKPSVDEMLQEQLETSQAFREKYMSAGFKGDAREAVAEMWVSKDGFLPMRIYNMMVLENVETGETVTLNTQADFGEYGEEPDYPVDAPAIYTKA